MTALLVAAYSPRRVRRLCGPQLRGSDGPAWHHDPPIRLERLVHRCAKQVVAAAQVVALRVAATVGSQALTYNIVLEPTESVGIPGASGGWFGEWIDNPVLNPAGANTWGSSNCITGLVSKDGVLGYSSLTVVPGTIIDINLIHVKYQGGSFTTLVEPVTRPICQITPRDCRPLSGIITLTINSNYPLRIIKLLVNGAVVPNLASYYSPTPNPPSYPAGINVWDVPVAALNMQGGQYLLHLEAIETTIRVFLIRLLWGSMN
jgi:hypothetical protein